VTTTGILRYDESSTADPTTTKNAFDNECSDETYTSLHPILEWEVPEVTNSKTLDPASKQNHSLLQGTHHS